jgi:hypothetical protein
MKEEIPTWPSGHCSRGPCHTFPGKDLHTLGGKGSRMGVHWQQLLDFATIFSASPIWKFF